MEAFMEWLSVVGDEFDLRRRRGFAENGAMSVFCCEQGLSHMQLYAKIADTNGR
jgi:hypothetical protein